MTTKVKSKAATKAATKVKSKAATKVKVIQKAAKPMPVTGKVFYDYVQGKLGIQVQGKDGAYGPPEYLSRVALRKTQAIVVNGNMGFLIGEVATETARLACKDAVSVSWVGYRFQTTDGQPVSEMATCFVVASDTPYSTPTPIILANGVK